MGVLQEASLSRRHSLEFAGLARDQWQPVTAYKNAEIKTLLTDLLGLEEIRTYGQKASETAKLLKAGLAAIRQEQAALDEESRRIVSEQTRLSGSGFARRAGRDH